MTPSHDQDECPLWFYAIQLVNHLEMRSHPLRVCSGRVSVSASMGWTDLSNMKHKTTTDQTHTDSE